MRFFSVSYQFGRQGDRVREVLCEACVDALRRMPYVWGIITAPSPDIHWCPVCKVGAKVQA